MARIGLSLESSIGRGLFSLSESGGVGGAGKVSRVVSSRPRLLFGRWCCCMCAFECLVLGPEPPAGNRASAHGTSRMRVKKSLIALLEYLWAIITSPQTRDETDRIPLAGSNRLGLLERGTLTSSTEPSTS